PAGDDNSRVPALTGLKIQKRARIESELASRGERHAMSRGRTTTNEVGLRDRVAATRTALRSGKRGQRTEERIPAVPSGRSDGAGTTWCGPGSGRPDRDRNRGAWSNRRDGALDGSAAAPAAARSGQSGDDSATRTGPSSSATPPTDQQGLEAVRRH